MSKEAEREIYFEFIAFANQVKVMAIDGKSGEEVSVIVPATASRLHMQQLATRKLEYMQSKRQKL